MCPLILHASTVGWFHCYAKGLRELYGGLGTPVCLSFAVCIPAILNNPSAEKHTKFSVSFLPGTELVI